jgi:hypothetical protein
MKKIILVLSISVLCFSCENQKEDLEEPYIAPCGTIVVFNACGVNDIGNNLKWLNDIIIASHGDTTGNYMGTIWYKRYNNQDLIITNMSLGSTGTLYHTFNCSHEVIDIQDINFYKSLTQKDIVYTRVCIN